MGSERKEKQLFLLKIFCHGPRDPGERLMEAHVAFPKGHAFLEAFIYFAPGCLQLFIIQRVWKS